MNLVNDIKQLEDSINANRQLLSNIMYRYNQSETKDELLAIQIRNMKENISTLTKQLNELENAMGINKVVHEYMSPAALRQSAPVAPIEPAVSPVSAPAPVATVPAAPVATNGPQTQKQVQPQMVKPKEAKKKSSLEASLGRSGMGIIASVLIFISFVLFAALLIPVLTDLIKFICMLGVSGIFTGIGLFKLRKDSKQPIWLSVLGCGIGGIYISLFFGDLLFSVINDIVLYICLLFWCGGVCYLSRRKSYIFQIIGYIGITISVILGSVLCHDTMDVGMKIFLFIYTIVALLIFAISHLNKEVYSKNWPAIVFSLINLVSLSIIDDRGFWVGGCILVLFSLVLLAYSLISKTENEKSFLRAFAIFSYGLFLFIDLKELLIDISYHNEIWAVICLIYFAVINFFFERIDWNRKSFSYHFVLFCIFVAYVASFMNLSDTFDVYLPMLIVSAAFFAISAFLNKSKAYKIYAVILAFIGAVDVPETLVTHVIIGLVFIAFYYLLTYLKKNTFDAATFRAMYIVNFIIVFAISFNICEYFSFSNENTLLLVSAVSGIINLVVMMTPLLRNPNTMEKDKGIYYIALVINKIFMLVTWICILTYQNALFVPIALLFFSATTMKLISKETFFPSMYVGIKNTLFTIAIMVLTDLTGLWISIVFFVLAIISIVIGFVIKRKGLRMYGLILSLISVVKLVLVDIDYDNSVMRAASFFICGIACFVISFIYNLVDKRMQAQLQEEKQEARIEQ